MGCHAAPRATEVRCRRSGCVAFQRQRVSDALCRRKLAGTSEGAELLQPLAAMQTELRRPATPALAPEPPRSMDRETRDQQGHRERAQENASPREQIVLIGPHANTASEAAREVTQQERTRCSIGENDQKTPADMNNFGPHGQLPFFAERPLAPAGGFTFGFLLRDSLREAFELLAIDDGVIDHAEDEFLGRSAAEASMMLFTARTATFCRASAARQM